MKDILDRIADSSANESSHELICRLRDCAHEIEALRSALACRPDAQADERYDLLQAAVNCPHEIESNRVVLHYSDKQPGHNALAQLRERLTRAAAPQAGAAQGAPTSEVIIDAFRRAGMNLDPTPNALYTVRGQHAQLIEGVRSLLAATPQPPQPAMSEERIATIQTLMLDWVDSKPGDEAKEVWNRIEEHLRTLAEPVAPAEQPRECGEPSEDAMAMSAALRMDEDGAIDERCPTRECGERQVAALSDEQARTVECADSWLRMRGLQTYTDLRDTLFAVLRAIGYTEEFAEAHPDLKVSEGVKLFLAASAPTLGEHEWPSDRDAAIQACALMILGICKTEPQEVWPKRIEGRIRYMLSKIDPAVAQPGLTNEQRETIQHAADKLRTVWANHTGDKESRELCHKLEALLAKGE